MSEPNNDQKPESSKNKREVYRMKRIPLNIDLDEAGEFRCVPDSSSCEDKEGARMILDLFRNMPEDRRAVWVPRLDTEEIFKRCPVIKKDPVLSKDFDEFFVAYGKNKRRTNQTDQQRNGGEKSE